MRRNLLAVIACLLLAVALSASAAAHPDHQHGGDQKRPEHHEHPQLDWSAFPADIQVLKTQLDQLRAQQKGLFEQIRQQREEIRSAHRSLTDSKRAALKGEAKQLVKKLHSTRESIRSLREKNHSHWEQFYAHNQAKQWDAAKSDLKSIIAVKQEILTQQKTIVQTQQRIVELMKK